MQGATKRNDHFLTDPPHHGSDLEGQSRPQEMQKDRSAEADRDGPSNRRLSW
jgi:hypothetical protein